MIKVVIVDELNVYSEGLQLIINSEEDMEVIGIVSEQQNNFSVMEELQPDIILFHVKLIHSQISDLVRNYKKHHPHVKMIYIAASFNKFLFYEAVQNKPDGFLLNDFPPEKFVAIIREVYQEHYILSGKIAQEMINGIQHLDELKKLVLKKKLQERNIEATMRDLDVLYLIYLRKNNKEITKDLKLPEKSVRYYVSKVYKKIERNNRTEAIELLEELIER